MAKISQLEIRNDDDAGKIHQFGVENQEYISTFGAILVKAVLKGDMGLFTVGLTTMLAEAYASGASEQAKREGQHCCNCED